jgi:Flp pilus assembly pilin Flp
MKAAMTQIATDEEGTTLVEFALVAPVLLLVLIVVLDFARAVNAYVTIANASREAARYATVHPISTELDRSAVIAFVATRVVPLDPGQMVVTISRSTSVGDPSCESPCWNASAPAPGVVTVRISYPWRAATFLAGTFFPGVPFETSSSMEDVR